MRIVKALATLALTVLPVMAAEVPRQSPELSIDLPGGKRTLLSNYRGKVVVVEFLFTTCPHCQRASQMMNKLYDEYGSKGFQPIGVAFNDMSSMLVPDFIRDFGVKYPVGWSSREQVMSFMQYSQDALIHVPQIVVIDRNGRIRQQSMPQRDEHTATEANLRAQLEKLLAEPAAKGGTSKAPAKKTSKKAS
jgi:peroxiredoxin